MVEEKNLPKLEVGKTVEKLLPMPPQDGPPLPRVLNIQWPWKKQVKVD